MRSFNGSTDHINVGTASVLQPTSAISISCWFNPVTLIGTSINHYIFSRTTVSGPPRLQWYGSDVTGTGVYFLQGNIECSGGSVTVPAQGLAAINTLYHGLITYDTTNGAFMYLNGTQSGPNAAKGNMNTDVTAQVWFGDSLSAPSPLNGLIADMAMWNVALTQTEATGLARGMRPNTIRPASLVGWWPLDGLQSPEPDLSGNQNNGTLTGTAAAFGPPFTLVTPKRQQFSQIQIIVPIPVGGFAAAEW